jgi:hypothetical protein
MKENCMTQDERIGLQQVLANGDLADLTAEQRVTYYVALCDSLGLNPLTRPLEYLELNGRLTLYAKRDATDQLRHKHHVSIEIVDRTIQDDVYIVRARATMPDGRTDESLGAVSLAGVGGEVLANSLMKAETKAKRRVALSICGLGMLDETEVETIANRSRAAAVNAAERPRLWPSEIFSQWDAQGHPSRRDLYDYVKATYGKRVTALTVDELQLVRDWIETQDGARTSEEVPSDAA